MASENSALLFESRARISRRTQFAIAGTACALLALSSLTMFAFSGSSRPAALVQQVQTSFMPQAMASAPAMQPVYYIPVAYKQGMLASAPAQADLTHPAVFYYSPANPVLKGMRIHLGQMLNGTGNETGNGTEAGEGDTAEDGEFSCTADHLVELSGKVQKEWDKCKKNVRYTKPNADAGRRLLGWEWIPDHNSNTAPKHPATASFKIALRNALKQHHAFHMLAGNDTGNATNATDDGGESGDEESDPWDYRGMSECMQEAVGESCNDMEDCDDSVCEHYYNEPEIEALCGICRIAKANDVGPFGSWLNVELWLVICLATAVVLVLCVIGIDYSRRKRKGRAE